MVEKCSEWVVSPCLTGTMGNAQNSNFHCFYKSMGGGRGSRNVGHLVKRHREFDERNSWIRRKKLGRIVAKSESLHSFDEACMRKVNTSTGGRQEHRRTPIGRRTVTRFTNLEAQMFWLSIYHLKNYFCRLIECLIIFGETRWSKTYEYESAWYCFGYSSEIREC